LIGHRVVAVNRIPWIRSGGGAGIGHVAVQVHRIAARGQHGLGLAPAVGGLRAADCVDRDQPFAVDLGVVARRAVPLEHVM